MGSFRLSAQKVHFTYKGHLDSKVIKTLFNLHCGGCKCLSIVHEKGDTDEENATPYDHTHVAVWWKQKPDITNVRAFDIDGVHPHMQNKRSAQWFQHIVTKYHLGHKTKANGKKYFIEPVNLWQDGVEDIITNETLLATIIGAPSLEDAMLESGIMPKSVSDIVTIRRECKRKAETEVEECVDVKRFKEFEWDRKKALVLKGIANCGKTNWAISQFKNPLLICELDTLKEINKNTDGLIFDEMLFGHVPKQMQIYLTDMAFDRVIRTRHSNAMIPKGLPRIFTCNEHEYVFGENPHESVTRRYEVLNIEEKMYA